MPGLMAGLERLPKVLLLLEGALLFAASVLVYLQLGASWWLFAGLLLVPDLSILGYLAGPRVGALLYDLAHTAVGPAGLALAGWSGVVPLGLEIGMIWLAHLGMDRAIGFGLKYPSGFQETHLDRV